MRVLASHSVDVFENLAMEEELLGDFDTLGEALFFYRNRPCVVWGKNQNPWCECDLPAARNAGVGMARRLSGGGAVYHDAGNLNYALILQRTSYTRERVLDRVMSALRTRGISATRKGTSLFTSEGKFSGSAFCFRGSAVLHHGTLLVASDLKGLNRLLKPCVGGIDTKAVISAPARVANLGPAGIRFEHLQDALVAEFAPEGRISDATPTDRDRWRSATDRLASWEWIFGLTPRFEVVLVDSPAPRMRLKVTVEEARIASAEGVDAGQKLPAELLNRLPFDAGLMAQRLALHGFSGLSSSLQSMKF